MVFEGITLPPHYQRTSFSTEKQLIWRILTMENKLYVGNLAFGTTDEDIQLLFNQAGAVKSVNLIKDRESGRSRGFAFVEMDSEEAAQEAIGQFHGIQFQGRQITVNIARPREERPRGAGVGDRPRGRFDGGGGGDRERRGNRSGGGYNNQESEGRRDW
jgi:RNA recognition motif-containing protein